MADPNNDQYRSMLRDTKIAVLKWIVTMFGVILPIVGVLGLSGIFIFMQTEIHDSVRQIAEETAAKIVTDKVDPKTRELADIIANTKKEADEYHGKVESSLDQGFKATEKEDLASQTLNIKLDEGQKRIDKLQDEITQLTNLRKELDDTLNKDDNETKLETLFLTELRISQMGLNLRLYYKPETNEKAKLAILHITRVTLTRADEDSSEVIEFRFDDKSAASMQSYSTSKGNYFTFGVEPAQPSKDKFFGKNMQILDSQKIAKVAIFFDWPQPALSEADLKLARDDVNGYFSAITRIDFDFSLNNQTIFSDSLSQEAIDEIHTPSLARVEGQAVFEATCYSKLAQDYFENTWDRFKRVLRTQ